MEKLPTPPMIWPTVKNRVMVPKPAGECPGPMVSPAVAMMDGMHPAATVVAISAGASFRRKNNFRFVDYFHRYC